MVDLLLRAEKPAVDTFKFQSQPLVVLQAWQGEVGKVAALHLAQPPGVGGKDGGGDGADLHPHHRQGGQDDREGAPSKAGEVMDGGDTFRAIRHGRHLHKILFLL